MCFLIELGVLKNPTGGAALPVGKLVFTIISNGVAQLLTAALATYLGRELFHAGGMAAKHEADLGKILSSMPSGLLTCEPSGQITFVNPSGAQMLGIDRDAPLPQVEEVLPGVLRLAPLGKRSELSLETRSERRVLGLTATQLDASGALLYVFQDLTDLRKAQVDLARADRLAALGKLSAQLAHEIRNPLAAMRGSAQMIAAEAQDPSTAMLGKHPRSRSGPPGTSGG